MIFACMHARTERAIAALIAALFLTWSPAPSLAGIADSPIPAPFTYHL
jgi:hypothetical protein